MLSKVPWNLIEAKLSRPSSSFEGASGACPSNGRTQKTLIIPTFGTSDASIGILSIHYAIGTSGITTST
jgi:hypothetical protein